VTSSFTTGIVSSIIPAPDIPAEHIKAFQLGITATFGNSGGPVFSLKSGRVFGVLSGGPRDDAGAPLPGIAVAQPVYPVTTTELLAEMKSTPAGVPVRALRELA